MKHRASQALVSELPVGSLPDWIQLLPGKGKIETRDGRGPYVNKSPQTIVANFKKFGMPVPMDYDHQSLGASQKSDGIPAAGWIREMEIRGNGEIWGRVEWTRKAAQMLAKREYRYLSPVFDYDKKTGEVQQIVSVGLTNNPNLYLRAAASQQGVKCMSLKNKLTAKMDELGDSANDDEALMSAVKSLLAAHGDSDAAQDVDDTAANDTDDVAAEDDVDVAAEDVDDTAANDTDDPAATPAKGLKDTTKQKKKVAHTRRRTGSSFDATRYVPMSMYREVKSQVEAINRKNIVDTVNAAIADGKIPPAEKKWALAYASRDLADFSAFVNRRSPIFTAKETAKALVKPERSVETVAQSLTADELHICKIMGKDPMKYAAGKIEAEKLGLIPASN